MSPTDDPRRQMAQSGEAVSKLNSSGLKAPRYAPPARRPAGETKALVEVPDELGTPAAFRLGFLGTGQGGSRLADAFWQQGYRRVAIFNTTEQDFHGLHCEQNRLSLDTGGSCKDPARGRRALTGREESVRDLLTRSWGTPPDYGMICVGLGGGTGSGTVAQLVQLVRDYMQSNKVGVIASLPSPTEGGSVARNAVEALRELVRMKVSPLLLVDNGRINDVYQPSLSALYETANGLVASQFDFFNRLAAVHSDLMTFDLSEFGQVLDSGMITLSSASLDSVKSPADISEAMRVQLEQTTLVQTDWSRATVGACLFVGDDQILSSLGLDYFNAGFTQLQRMLRDDTRPVVVHRGVYRSDTQGLQVFTMLGGLAVPETRIAELMRVGGLQRAGGESSVAAFFGV